MMELSRTAGVSGSETPYLELANVGYSFAGYEKQAGSKWLQVCLFGLCLKQMDV